MLYCIFRLIWQTLCTCSMSSQCTHAFCLRIASHAACGLLRLLSTLLPIFPLAVQRYDTKTILTNFCVKISQWNAFLGRRRHFFRIVLGRMLRHLRKKPASCMAAMRHDDNWMMSDMALLDYTASMRQRIGPPRCSWHAQRPWFPPEMRTLCTRFNKH